ncbi:MAG: peptide deformylase [Proteobacteria bacterium]|nr:peptide deformylase [Pseudomonadota bacterium]
MALLEIVEWPSKVLETPAIEVRVFDDSFRMFVSDMHETMRASKGIGLAANQVGDLRRVVVIEIPRIKTEEGVPEGEIKWWYDKTFTFVNPIITKREGVLKWQEGCLSFPDVFDFVDRSANIMVTAKDEYGKEFEVEADELFAVCLQHEIDHIDGIVFFKRMSRLKAERIRSKMLKRGNLNVRD